MPRAIKCVNNISNKAPLADEQNLKGRSPERTQLTEFSGNFVEGKMIKWLLFVPHSAYVYYSSHPPKPADTTRRNSRFQ